MSWFYRIVKETLTGYAYSVFLENQKTFPGEIYTNGSGIDALIVPPPTLAINHCFFAEIKSLDEYANNNWLSSSGNHDPLQNIRDYWNRHNPIPGQNLNKNWAVVITGQLEKYFYKKPALINKQHPKLPPSNIFNGNNYKFVGNNAISGCVRDQNTQTCYRLKRTIICDSDCRVDVVNTLRYIGCINICDAEFSANQLPWLKFNVISFNKPPNNGNHLWYTP